jgi:hypothetical protein
VRTIDQILKDALANQSGEPILRVLTWNDQADYIANPTAPDNTWACSAFDIYNTSASATLAAENNYVLSDFTVFIIERGISLNSIEYTVKSGLYFVKKYREDFGQIKIEGSSYPNLKISIAGDDTYENVIQAFCTAIGKTAVFKKEDDAWLDYQFLPDGKSINVNKAELFENMLRQKYTILVYEESPGNLVFYNQDSFNQSAWKDITWASSIGQLAVVAASGKDPVTISDDGISWHPQTAPAFYNSIAWSPALNLYAAVGASVCATSPDGVTWTPRTIPAGNYNSVINILGTFLAVGESISAFSYDGINWSALVIPAGIYNAVSGDGVNGGLPTFSVAVGISVAATNNNTGAPWTARTIPAGTYNAVVYRELAPGISEILVAVGEDVCATSPSGVTWTARTIPAGTYNGIATNGVGFVAVGDGICATSPDGINWTARTPAAPNVWESVIYAPSLGLYIAVASTGKSRVQTSPDGIDWTIVTSETDFTLTYQDGPASHLLRDQSSVHYLWRDEDDALHTSGDTTLPQWNLGYLESTDDPPITHEDAYYKIFLQKAPVRLDITDGDKIHFIPYWSIDPTKTIDAMMQVSEHLNLTKSPSWYQEIKSITLFSSTEGGVLPSTIERVAAYTPLVSAGFDRFLSTAVNNLQALATWIDDFAMSAAAVATYVAANYAPIANGVTNGNSHNHVGGDGAALNYSYTIATFLNGVSIPASTTYYSCPFKIGADATQNQFPWPEGGVLSNLNFRISAAQPASGSLVATLFVNGSATAIVVTIAAGSAGGTYSDNTHTATIVAGDTLRWDIVNNATAGGAAMTALSMKLTKQTT